MSLRCTADGPCDAHKDGVGNAGEKCAYYCDADGCRRRAVHESRSGRSYCREHAGRAGRPVSTRSSTTPKVFFRLSALQRAQGEAIAAARGQTIGEMAKQAFLAEVSRAP